VSEPAHHLSGWERMARAVEKVRERLMRTVAVLEAAHVPYAVVGGHAVAVWVDRAGEGGVRNTPDVDILIRRTDVAAAKAAMAAAGFVHRIESGIDVFLDDPGAKPRDAVHLVFAGGKVRPDDIIPAPDVTESEPTADFRVVTLDALVGMKLTSHRRKDRVHIRDMIDVGLIDATWPAKFPPELAGRLQQLLDDPDG
jgi:GrpB-like predicted nucleotidyltransferase (UPF0157 family)